MSKTFYITTPIFYPSGKLHLGNLYSMVLAKTLINYKHLLGYDTYFVSGLDEHGQKIKDVAKNANLNVEAYIDTQAVLAQKLWKDFDVAPDYFVRTSAEDHKKTVQGIFQKLLDNKLIAKGLYRGFYSVKDEEFVTTIKAIQKDGKWFHPISNHELIEIKEKTYFLKISGKEEWLAKVIDGICIPKKAVNEINNSFLKKGLEDLALTRKNTDWGIEVIGDEKYVIYVWIDALISYISALGYGKEIHTNFDKYWNGSGETVHIIGKEIRRFHLVYWPIILDSLNLKLPTMIISHGWLTIGGKKMSKSKGNAFDPYYLKAKYGAEELKFYLVTQFSHFEDTNFNEKNIGEFYNAHLANNFGNLVSRVFKLIDTNFTLPVKFIPSSNFDDVEILKKIEQTLINFKKLLDSYSINDAFRKCLDLSHELNVYIEKRTPWFLKSDDKKLELETILNILLNGIYAVGLMINVVMPMSLKKLLVGMGIEEFKWDEVTKWSKFDKLKTSAISPLFKRLKLEE